MDKFTKRVNAAALVACTVLTFLTSHRVGQAFKQEDWLAVPLYGALLALLVWMWFRLEREVKKVER